MSLFSGERDMVLRLFLAGLVVGLGVTLPSGGRLESWGSVARGWINSRLAEWDARAGTDGHDFVLIDEPAPAVAPGAPAAVAPVPTDPSPTTAAVARDLNATAAGPDLAEGLDAPTAPAAPDDREINLTSAGLELSSLDAAFQVAQVDLLGLFASEVVTAPAPAPACPDAAFDAAQAEFLAAFATTPQNVARRAPHFEPIDLPDDLYAGAAHALNRQSEGLNLQASPARGPAFGPIDVPENLYAGAAYALNRQSEGLERPLALATARPAGPHGRDPRFTQAVRLTQEAVYAWVSLLHGPAVVTLGH
jgi:hypothetical protein